MAIKQMEIASAERAELSRLAQMVPTLRQDVAAAYRATAQSASLAAKDVLAVLGPVAERNPGLRNSDTMELLRGLAAGKTPVEKVEVAVVG